jgi:hypothetical protein
MLKGLLTLFIALFLGGGSAVFIFSNPDLVNIGIITNGPWRTSLTYGSRDSNIYEKAVVAKTGLFALNKSETLYFTAFHDDAGRPLNAGYNYRIEGRTMETRWWSVTVYGEDSFLIPNKQKRYAYTKNSVNCEADGSYIIRLSRNFREGNWLNTGKDRKRFSLTLRLYNPSPNLYENLRAIRLPRIIREEGP